MLAKLEKIAYILLCVLMVDCSIFGGGRLISFGPITFRMMVLMLLLLCSIPIMLKNFKQIFTNKYFLSVIAFATCVLIMGGVGFVNNHRTHLILTDIKGFMYFIPVPAMICLLNNKKRIHTLMKSMMYANVFAAIATIIFLFIYIRDASLFNEINGYLYTLQVTYAGGVSATILRMFYRSALYLLCGCAFSMYFYLNENKHFQYPLITGLCLFAILTTYTRSFYLATGITAIGIIIVAMANRVKRKAVVHFFAKAVLAFGCLLIVIGGINRTNYLEFAITRTITTFPVGEQGSENPNTSEGPNASETPGNSEQLDNSENDGVNEYIDATKESDSYRQMTLQGLWRNIKKSPVFGLGLGAEFVERPDGLNEYIYLDIWSKMGIVGLILFFMPVILAIVSFIKNRRNLINENIYVLFVFMVLMGFMSYSLFNPFMNASVGILYYSCVLAVVNCWEKSIIQEE